MMTTLPLAAPRYTRVAMALHWLLAVAIVSAFAMGLYLDDLPLSPSKFKLISWHKWAGVSILVLSLGRLLWRLTHRPPALPLSIEGAMPAWQRVAHHGVHHLMYGLFFVVPLLGWAYSSAKGFPIVWFGVLPLPDWVPVDPALAAAIKPWHGLAAFALMGLVALHVGAALKHQFVDRDGLMRRMWPLAVVALVCGVSAGLPSQAQAQTNAAQSLVPAQSELGFVAKQLGVPLQGRFKVFAAQTQFNPQSPQSSQIAFQVDLGSVSLDPDSDAELRKPEWFGTAKFPKAQFQSTGIKALGNGRFEVAGKLSIKGTARDVVVPVQVTQAKGLSTVTGNMVLKRLDFKIGEGDWADTSIVANDVQVHFKLVLQGVAPL